MQTQQEVTPARKKAIEDTSLIAGYLMDQVRALEKRQRSIESVNAKTDDLQIMEYLVGLQLNQMLEIEDLIKRIEAIPIIIGPISSLKRKIQIVENRLSFLSEGQSGLCEEVKKILRFRSNQSRWKKELSIKERGLVRRQLELGDLIEQEERNFEQRQTEEVQQIKQLRQKTGKPQFKLENLLEQEREKSENYRDKLSQLLETAQQVFRKDQFDLQQKIAKEEAAFQESKSKLTSMLQQVAPELTAQGFITQDEVLRDGVTLLSKAKESALERLEQLEAAKLKGGGLKKESTQSASDELAKLNGILNQLNLIPQDQLFGRQASQKEALQRKIDALNAMQESIEPKELMELEQLMREEQSRQDASHELRKRLVEHWEEEEGARMLGGVSQSAAIELEDASMREAIMFGALLPPKENKITVRKKVGRLLVEWLLQLPIVRSIVKTRQKNEEIKQKQALNKDMRRRRQWSSTSLESNDQLPASGAYQGKEVIEQPSSVNLPERRSSHSGG